MRQMYSVLCLRAATGESVAQPVDPPRVQPDQFLPGGFVTAKATRYEAVIRVQASFYQIAAANTHYLVGRSTASLILGGPES